MLPVAHLIRDSSFGFIGVQIPAFGGMQSFKETIASVWRGHCRPSASFQSHAAAVLSSTRGNASLPMAAVQADMVGGHGGTMHP